MNKSNTVDWTRRAIELRSSLVGQLHYKGEKKAPLSVSERAPVEDTERCSRCTSGSGVRALACAPGKATQF